MTSTTKTPYAGHRFPPELISYTVWLYFRFPLSLRMVEEMLAFRGIEVSHETIRQWALKFGQEFANIIRRRLPRPGDKWHLDEVVLKIAGKTHYLWRAVDRSCQFLGRSFTDASILLIGINSGEQLGQRAEGPGGRGLTAAAVKARTDQRDGAERGAELQPARPLAQQATTAAVTAPMPGQEARRLGGDHALLDAGQHRLGLDERQADRLQAV